MKPGQYIAHGDILVVKVSNEAVDTTAAKPVASKVPGRTVLAYGEVTGHHHSIDASVARLFEASGVLAPKVGPYQSEDKGDTVLVLDREATLEHQEHAPLGLDAGSYIVRQQYEYSASDIRAVRD